MCVNHALVALCNVTYMSFNAIREKKSSHEKNFLVTTPIFGPRREKTCLRWFVNNKGADQPALPRRLIRVFVICFLDSLISKLAKKLASVALQTDLSLIHGRKPQKLIFSRQCPLVLVCLEGILIIFLPVFQREASSASCRIP